MRLCASLRQRMGSRNLRETARQMRRMRQSSISSPHGRCRPLASFGRRCQRRAIRRRRLSAAAGRDLLVPGCRFRQERLAEGCSCLSRDLPASEPPGHARALALRAGRSSVALLRGARASGARPPARLPRADGDDGAAAGAGLGLVRQALSEPGYDAAGRLRQSDRLAAAESAAGPGKQRVSRRRPRSLDGSVGLSFERAQARSRVDRGNGPGCRARRPRAGRALAAARGRGA